MDESNDQPEKKKKKLPRGRPWQKGQSGNPKGRPPVRVDVTTQFVEAMAERIPERIRVALSDKIGREIPKRWTYLQLWARRMRDDACNGDHNISKFIWERLEGKVKEQISHSFETPLEVVNQEELKDPYAPDQLSESVRQFVESGLLPENVARALIRSIAPDAKEDEIFSKESAPN